MKEGTKKFISAMATGFVILLGPALVAATILFYKLWTSPPELLIINVFPFFIIFAGALIVYIASITNWIISRRIIKKLKESQ